MADQYPIYLAAAVQMAPVWMDREATTQKVCDLIQTARGRGAELIVFPEVIIPGSPHWIWFEPEDYDLYTTLFKNFLYFIISFPSLYAFLFEFFGDLISTHLLLNVHIDNKSLNNRIII